MRTTRLVVLLIALASVMSCSTHQRTAASAAQQAEPLAKPAATPNEHAGHDMAAMGSHAKAETAFLFPNGDDKGWSKVENGSQHNMAPEVPLVSLTPETRTQLLRQLGLTMDVIKKFP